MKTTILHETYIGTHFPVALEYDDITGLIDAEERQTIYDEAQMMIMDQALILPVYDYVFLTGLHNRQYFEKKLAARIEHARMAGERLAVFFMDGDKEWPTICGTGTEDYFGGAWNFEQPKGQYALYSTPFLGLSQIITPDGLYKSQQRFGMYRWHIPDPIRFEQDLRVTIQALGWMSGGRYLQLQDDIASVAYWYQELPHASFPQLSDKDALEVN